MAVITQVTIDYQESLDRFALVGTTVEPLGDSDQYHAIFLPEGTQPGDLVTLQFQLGSPAGMAFGTSPVQWIALEPEDLEYYEPVEPPKDEVLAVRRVSSSEVQIDLAVAADAASYRLLLVTFYDGRILDPIDPTIINRPKNPGGG